MNETQTPLVGPPDSGLTWEMIDRYYAGDATAEERKLVEAGFAVYAKSSNVVRQVAADLRQSDERQQGVSTGPVAGMLASLHDRMQPKQTLRRIVQTCFGGSVERAVAALLDTEDTELPSEEIERLRHAIQIAKREGR